MNILLIFPGFIVALIIVFCYEHKIKLIKARLICKEHNKNKLHAYVARDKDGSLWLYFNKPLRGDEKFFSMVNVTLSQYKINHLGLNKADYDNLKWENEPLEVFVNMEDL